MVENTAGIIFAAIGGSGRRLIEHQFNCAHGIDHALKRYLVAGGALKSIDIKLKDGHIALAGLTINPPQGFGTDPLFSLNTLELEIDPTSLFGDEIVVKQLTLKELAVVLVRNKQGQISLIKLLPPNERGEGARLKKRPAKHRCRFPLFVSIRFAVRNLSVRLIDPSVGAQWSAGLGLDLIVDLLHLKDLLNRGVIVGGAKLGLRHIKVDQPAGFSETPLLAIDEIELATPGFALDAGRIPFSKVHLNNLAVSLERNQDGVMSVQPLRDAWVLPASATKPPKRTATGPPSAGDKPQGGP